MRSLVTALRKIQSQFGYLKREALEQYSEQTGVPLYRLHSVASFFPHFQLIPPKPVTLKVCRDMACHMAGSGKMLRDLKDSLGKDNGARMIHVEGVSCLGRCDRAPAACVSVTGSERSTFLARAGHDRSIRWQIAGIRRRHACAPDSRCSTRSGRESSFRKICLAAGRHRAFPHRRAANQIRRCLARAGGRSLALLAYRIRLGQGT
ncbi:MAG: hypothetical protein DMF00_10795 [Verrucomicrobia bacterium]|nr:MAG: hypothetical protein DMF00_10795 [Verrucomicrobiota bacterium]